MRNDGAYRMVRTHFSGGSIRNHRLCKLAISDLHRDLLFFGRFWRRVLFASGSLSFSVYEFRGFRRNVLFNNCTINRFGLGKLPSQAF